MTADKMTRGSLKIARKWKTDPMEVNGQPHTDDRDPGAPPRGPAYAPAPGTGRKIALLTFLLLLIPVFFAAVVFPAFSGQPFGSVAEVNPAEIKKLRVQLLNRKELDHGEDVGPYLAAPEDYAALLEPLKAVPEVPDFGGARGPFFGEYRVLLTNGRRATIKLYWHTNPLARPGTPARLRFQIGPRKYEGGTAAAVIAVATACEPRGEPDR